MRKISPVDCSSGSPDSESFLIFPCTLAYQRYDSDFVARPARCAVLNNSDAAELTVIKDCNGSIG
jgi:hypothetical protein